MTLTGSDLPNDKVPHSGAMTPTDRGTDGPRPPKIRNLVELAKLAGVSTGTVSRALANKAIINIHTRERIQALARLHGFRPNQMASKLRMQRTGVIGIVIPLGHERRQHISDPFFMTLLGHLADGLTENGYDLMLSRVVPDDEDWLDRIVDSGMLDGVLLIGQSNQFDVIERVAAGYRPLVVWGGHGDDQVHCSVGSDNWLGGRIAAAHLIAQGRRRLAYLGDTAPPEIAQRFQGVSAAASEAGLGPVEILTTHLASDDMERDIAGHIARIGTAVDGIIAASDVIAMTALRVLADQGINVPDDIALIGFDDLPLAAQTVPRLTTISQDIAGGAAAMVDALFRRIGGDDTPSVIMPPKLVGRDSG
jgi:DNA-binding LacI/PurR family transcriptional regulator